ncbi:MAG TPA: FAD-dependent oxidoreductase, partial [Caldilineales bacterium]|nr:FAD-dependent oxidoreductase [Caldilineales bacterium]
LVHGEDIAIQADMVINAAGAWSGKIAAMAGARVDIVPGKGIMIATAHRIVNSVINRCKWPSDGDILVPAHTVSIIGTTDTPVADPEDLRIEEWEIRKMLEEGEKLAPGFKKTRIMRVWAGVRPLYKETHVTDDRDISRKFTLLDHQTRDGVAGLITITGGKLTTFRLMAEKAVDRAAAYLGARRPCATATTPVPGARHGYYWLGHRLKEVEEGGLQNQLICECELVTRGMLENAARRNPTIGLDDLRRDVRLGMGPCQGGFCTYRAVGVIHELNLGHAVTSDIEVSDWKVADLHSPASNPSDEGVIAGETGNRGNALYNPNLLLRDFLQERWRGVVPIVWGQQLKQEQLDRLIYLDIMNGDHLPDAGLKSPLSDFYHKDMTPNDHLEEAHD